MTRPSTDGLLRELDRRVRRLRCLTRPTRQRVAHFARETATAEQLRAYLDGPVTFVEREIAPVNHVAFRRLCMRCASPKNVPRLWSDLGVSGPGAAEAGYAVEIGDDPAACGAWLECARRPLFKGELRSWFVDVRNARSSRFKSIGGPGQVTYQDPPAAAWLYCLANHHALRFSTPDPDTDARALSWLNKSTDKGKRLRAWATDLLTL